MPTDSTVLDDESRQAFAQWDDDEKESRTSGEVRIFQTQPSYSGRGRGNSANRSDSRRPGRGGSNNRPSTEDSLREREDPHYGKPTLDRLPHFDETTEELIFAIIHDDQVRANLSRDTLSHLSGREDFLAVWAAASYRGNQYFKGSRNELASKLIFESINTLINLIKDDAALESTISKLNLNRRKPMPNELTRLIEFEGVLGDEVLMAIDSATAPDDRRSALLMGLRRILLRFYGQTLETYAVYKTAESQSLSQLHQYFQTPQKFARQLVWPHIPSPRWNPPLLPARSYHNRPKTPVHGARATSPILGGSQTQTELSLSQQTEGSDQTHLTGATAPTNSYNAKEKKSTGFVDQEQAILLPNLILKIDTNKLLTMNEATNK